MMKRLFALLCLCLIVVMSGCGEKAPDGFPKIFPCQITVTDGGTPIDGVAVKLTPDQPMNNITVYGTTDASGKVAVTTLQGTFGKEGAPEGGYTVTLTKFNPVEVKELSDDEFYKMSAQERATRSAAAKKEREAARVVPEVLSKATSPLKLTVDSSGGNLEVDINEYR